MADEWMSAVDRLTESKAGLALFSVWVAVLAVTLIW
jgi:hypothetical protein